MEGAGVYAIYVALIGAAVTIASVWLQIRERRAIRQEQREDRFDRRASDRWRENDNEDERPALRVLKRLELCQDERETLQDRYDRLQRRHSGALEQLDELVGKNHRLREENHRLQVVIDREGLTP